MAGPALAALQLRDLPHVQARSGAASGLGWDMPGLTTLRCRTCRTPLVRVGRTGVRPLVVPDAADKQGVNLTCPTCGERRRVSMQAPGVSSE